MKILDFYINLILNNPVKVIFVTILLFFISLNLASNIGNKNIEMDEIMSSDVEVVRTLNIIEDEFQPTDSLNLVIQIDYNKEESNINDLRESEVVRYSYLLGEEISNLDQVREVNSLGSYIKTLNDGFLTNSINEFNDVVKTDFKYREYINAKNDIVLIKVNLEKNFDADELLYQINKIIDNSQKPYGIKVSVSGTEIAQSIVMENLSDDMTKTSIISAMGIIIILLIIFRSIFYGFIPLSTIFFGLIWAFGYVGFIGLKMSSASSGVVSMIMGIGIDFGIQIISRFKTELKDKPNPKDAMFKTINAVFKPMFITTIAGVIGFQSMRLGNLSVLADMGIIMTYGIVACFLAAITIVPTLVIVYEQYKINKNKIK